MGGAENTRASDAALSPVASVPDAVDRVPGGVDARDVVNRRDADIPAVRRVRHRLAPILLVPDALT